MRKASIYEVFSPKRDSYITPIVPMAQKLHGGLQGGTEKAEDNQSLGTIFWVHVIVLMNSKILFVYLRSSQSKFQQGPERASSALRRNHGEFMIAGKGRVSFPQWSNPNYREYTPMDDFTPIHTLN